MLLIVSSQSLTTNQRNQASWYVKTVGSTINFEIFFKSIYEKQHKNEEIRDKALLKCLAFNRSQFLIINL